MFCENCGKPIESGAAFCEHCGAKLTEEVQAAPVAAAPAAAPVAVAAAPKVDIVARVKQLHAKNKFILPGIAAAIVVIIAVCLIVSALGKQVTVSDYLNVEVTGYEGNGQLHYDFDETAFALRALGLKEYDRYDSAENLDEDDLTLLEKKYKSQWKSVEKLISTMEITYELPEGRTSTTLKNGDVVTISVVLDENRAKDLGITPKRLTLEYTVAELKPVSAYDPFANFEVKFEGYQGYGSYSLVCSKTEELDLGDLIFVTTEGDNYIRIRYKDGGYSDSIYVYAEGNNGGLSNGDQVKLTASANQDNWLSQGVQLTQVETQVEVSGLKDMVAADLKDYITLEFTGLDGDGSVKVVSKQDKVTIGELVFDFVNRDVYLGNERLTYFSFSLSKTWSLTNGEEITLTVDSNTDRLARYGVILDTEPEAYTVAGLASYATNLDAIRNSLGSVVESATSVLSNWLYDSWDYAVHNSYWSNSSNPEIVVAPALYKTLLTTPKSTDSYTKNTLWLIFTATLNDSKLGEAKVLYFALALDNIAVQADGTVYLTDTSFDKHYAREDYETIYNEKIVSFNLNIFE